MADQQFCLRWNNHQSTLISVFDTLLENGTLVDCTLAAEGQYLKAHKVVLSACSPYLEALLSQHYEKHPIVILKDVKFTELKSMMDYMYRGEVNICQDQLGTFLKAAESLQIKGLSDNAEGDARDVGSTTKAPPPPRKATVPAQPARPAEPQRPDVAPASPALRSRDGSISPSSRKRRRIRRASQGEDSNLGDNHLDTTSNSCDLPSQAQSTPIVPNIPASITTTPIKTPIVKPEINELSRIDNNSLPPESGLLKEKIEPLSEPLLEPKTEYIDEMNNDDSVEDLTLDDDDEMDGMDISNMSNMSNMSRPGPSHGTDVSNQGFAPWHLGGNQSGTDEVFMAAQEAVSAHRDSQGFNSRKRSLRGGRNIEVVRNETAGSRKGKKAVKGKADDPKCSSRSSVKVEKIFSRDGRELGEFFRKKRSQCPKCGDFIHKKSMKLHTKYYCGKQHDESQWKLVGSMAFCKKCNKNIEPNAIEFHVGFMCKKKTIPIQCFYCCRIFKEYKGMLLHSKLAHNKSHCYKDLISILSKRGHEKVVTNYLNVYLSTTEEAYSEGESRRVQVRQKTTHSCPTCGKVLVGTHTYENHVNTKCESENQYSCFYCNFKADYPYLVLEHMDDVHNEQTFDTIDVIKAQLTGISAVMQSSEVDGVPEDSEIEFENRHLLEPSTLPFGCDEEQLPLTPAIGDGGLELVNQQLLEQTSSSTDDDEIDFAHHQLFEPPYKQSNNVVVKQGEHSKNINTSENGMLQFQNGVGIYKGSAPLKIPKRRGIKLEKDDSSVSKSEQNFDGKIEFMEKMSLKVAQKKVRINCKVFGKKRSGKIACFKCSEKVNPRNFRIHKKYHCGQRDVKREWILKNNHTAFCLRCKRLRNSQTIDFHVNYVCKKKSFLVRCLYCTKVARTYHALITHMNKAHRKVHFFHDLMSILPIPNNISSPNKSADGDNKVLVNHKSIYVPSVYDTYSCLVEGCSYANKAAYKVIDHMEYVHNQQCTLYKLLENEMFTFDES